ncbi:MAG: RNA-binding domain-containing protein [Candidatus Binatia bacterium]
MEWPDILKRIKAGEDSHAEFKRGLGNLKDIGRAICAFANSEGGVIILGVDDSGAVVGVKEEAEKVQERLTTFLQSGCSAPVSARCGRHADPSGWVHWIEVPRQRGYEPLRYGGRVWVRRERSSVEPSPTELQELYNAFGYILTEARAIQAAGVADIDQAAFRAYLRALGLETTEEPQPTTEDDLRNRGALTEIDGALHPTLYGIMAFGKEPQRFPQTASFWVECAAYAGRDRASDVLLVGQGKGRLDEQVQRAAGWVRGLGRIETYSGLVRTDTPLVPEKALREAIVNAVAHRDYAITGSKVLLEVFSDRIDVTSPGLLPNHMTVESVLAGGHPRSRNELIANYLLVTGLMEQRGRGWPVMRRAMREFNGTEAELLQDAGGKFVRVTLRFSRDDSRVA